MLLSACLAPEARAQGTEFSWRMGPVDLAPGQTAKLTFANPFCLDQRTELDITLALTDLSGKVLQLREYGSAQPAVAKKRAIVKCDEALQLEVSGEQATGTVVGILQVITDISGVPWVPVSVPLASLQIGSGSGHGFKPSIVIIPVEPIRRLLLQ